jgi:hypothetical protein
MPQIASLFFSDLEKKEKQHEGERECVCVEGRQGASKQARASSSSSSSSSRRGKKARAFVLAKGKWRSPWLYPPVVEFPTLRFLAVHQCLLKRCVGLVNYPRGTVGWDRLARLLVRGVKRVGKCAPLSLSLSVPVWDPHSIICCDSFWRFWRCSFGNMLSFFVLHRTSEHESHDAKHEHTGHKRTSPLKFDEGSKRPALAKHKHINHNKTSPFKF